MRTTKIDRFLLVLLTLALVWGAWSSYQNMQLRREGDQLAKEFSARMAWVVLNNSGFIADVNLDPDMGQEELDLLTQQIKMMSFQSRQWGMEGFVYYYDSMLYAIEQYHAHRDKEALIQALQVLVAEMDGLLDLVVGPRQPYGGRTVAGGPIWFDRMLGRDEDFNHKVSQYIIRNRDR